MGESKKEGFMQLTEEQRQQLFLETDLDPLIRMERVFQLWWSWADFQISVTKPKLSRISPPELIKPAPLVDGTGEEFVYTIHDHGDMLAASKAEDMMECSQSMCKLHYTIEKMVFILTERLKSSGITGETEVHVMFGGHQNAQRKGFESIINLPLNIIVTNFDPGVWGERYLQLVERLAKMGYGYPSEAPRDFYRKAPKAVQSIAPKSKI